MNDKESPSELDRLVENIVTAMDAEDSKVYTDEVISEFRDPANVGPLDDADGTGVADGLCMDSMQMWVRLERGARSTRTGAARRSPAEAGSRSS